MAKPHPNADLIKAWADGHPIQWRFIDSPVWRDLAKSETPTLPQSEVRYRIKPEPEQPTRYWRAWQSIGGEVYALHTDLKCAADAATESISYFARWLNDWQPLE
jgi:hypothetical protein